MTDDTLDKLLRNAMAARPEPPDATNLAARAIALSRAERRAPTPAVSPIARRLTTLFAAIAAIVVLFVGYAKLTALIAANAATSALSTTYASEVAPTLAVGGVGLMIALAYIVLRGTLTIEDDPLRID